MKTLQSYLTEDYTVSDFEQDLGIKQPLDFEMFVSNLFEILRQYSSREMAFIKLYDYINNYPQFQKQLIELTGASNATQLKSWAERMQKKLRKGVALARREARAEYNVARILQMAQELS